VAPEFGNFGISNSQSTLPTWSANQVSMTSPNDGPFEGVEALIFDVFGKIRNPRKLTWEGTVVDWRSSVVNYLRTLPQPSTPLNHEQFAQDWRHGYFIATSRYASSPDPEHFKTIDEIHFDILLALVEKYNLKDVWNESQLKEINLIWHRLHGWPDSIEGLQRLKSKYIIGTLSNGNARLLIDMAKFADLPWDVIFSGDLLKAYKPNRRMYLGACEYLQLPPEKVGMVVNLYATTKSRLRHISWISKLRKALD
jgi:2-haloalkanoic acid dehalogenase type II